jgi:hypothetical protein
MAGKKRKPRQIAREESPETDWLLSKRPGSRMPWTFKDKDEDGEDDRWEKDQER